MSYRRLFFLYALILALFVAQKMFGENHNAAAPCPDNTECAARYKDDGGLKERELDVLAVLTKLPKTALRKSYGATLPPAMEAAKKGDQNQLDDTLADIFGRINAEQRKIAEQKQGDLMAAAAGDPRAVLLVEGILRRIKAVDHPEDCKKDTECAKIMPHFLLSHGQTMKENDGFYNDLRIAAGKKMVDGKQVDATPEETRAAWGRLLRDYDKESMLAWWEGQKNSKNTFVEHKFMEAAFKNGFLDVFSKEKGAERIHAPSENASTQQLSDLVSNYGKGRGGLSTVGLAATPHAENTFAHYPAAPEPGTVSKAGAPRPQVEQPKADQPKADQPKADQPKADQPKADQPKADQPKADQPKADQPQVTTAPTDSEIYSILGSKCAVCHKAGGEAAHKTAMLMSSNGVLENKAGAVQKMFTRVVTRGNMPPERNDADEAVTPLTADEKARIEAWARANGAH